MDTRPPSPSVPGTPEQVRERLQQRLVRVRSVWFPSPRELRTWDGSSAPLYVVWHGPRTLEVGPRLASMWASAFSPVLRGELVQEGDRTRLELRRSWPRITLAVLGVWWIVVVAWGVLLALGIRPEGESPMVVMWWAVLALTVIAGPGIGWTLGGRHLDESRAFLTGAAGEDVVDGEDW